MVQVGKLNQGINDIKGVLRSISTNLDHKLNEIEDLIKLNYSFNAIPGSVVERFSDFQEIKVILENHSDKLLKELNETSN